MRRSEAEGSRADRRSSARAATPRSGRKAPRVGRARRRPRRFRGWLCAELSKHQRRGATPAANAPQMSRNAAIRREVAQTEGRAHERSEVAARHRAENRARQFSRPTSLDRRNAALGFGRLRRLRRPDLSRGIRGKREAHIYGKTNAPQTATRARWGKAGATFGTSRLERSGNSPSKAKGLRTNQSGAGVGSPRSRRWGNATHHANAAKGNAAEPSLGRRAAHFNAAPPPRRGEPSDSEGSRPQRGRPEGARQWPSNAQFSHRVGTFLAQAPRRG